MGILHRRFFRVEDGKSDILYTIGIEARQGIFFDIKKEENLGKHMPKKGTLVPTDLRVIPQMHCNTDRGNVWSIESKLLHLTYLIDEDKEDCAPPSMYFARAGQNFTV